MRERRASPKNARVGMRQSHRRQMPTPLSALDGRSCDPMRLLDLAKRPQRQGQIEFRSDADVVAEAIGKMAIALIVVGGDCLFQMRLAVTKSP